MTLSGQFGVGSRSLKEKADVEEGFSKLIDLRIRGKRVWVLKKLVKNISGFCLFSPPVFYKKVCLGITLPPGVDVRRGCSSFLRFRTHSTNVDDTLKESLYMHHR